MAHCFSVEESHWRHRKSWVCGQSGLYDLQNNDYQKNKYFQTILSFNQPFTDFLVQVTSSKAQTDHRPTSMTHFNRETVCH